MKYSIIIPTYNKLDRALAPCLESVVRYTDLNDAEIIVVCNGCTDGTRGHLEGAMQAVKQIRYLWFDEAIGYTKAANAGIKDAKGDYVILLNNDTVLLDQKVNQWLDIMNLPFADPKMGVTGPMKGFSPAANNWFLIFFCVMIRRVLFDSIGYLDEIFSPGYGEDTDFCLRAERYGYKVQQVPTDERLYSDNQNKRMIGNFPIWHEGNVTFRDFDENDKFLSSNDEILSDRWNPPFITIDKAMQVDGFMSKEELKWLAIQATKHLKMAEVGSWLGRSTRVMIDNMNRHSATLWAIDHWNGSAGERDTFHQAATWAGGDWAYYTFLENTYDAVQFGTLIPLRMSSDNGAAFVKKHAGQLLDFVFIDAGHTYEEVKDDIRRWLPLVREGGIICGHDYYFDNAWPGVRKAVDELEGVRVVPNTSIWWKMVGKNDLKPKVYDCFPFFNELDILEIRMRELNDVVDRWVIVEATKSHSGQDKPLYFRDNLERFQPYLHKVTHIVVDSYPEIQDIENGGSWTIERHQRDAIMQGLTDCRDNDIILIGDVDEIPRASAIEQYYPEKGLCCVSLKPNYCYANMVADQPWNWLRIIPYGMLRKMTPCQVRYTPNYDPLSQIILPDGQGGWHLSFMGGVDKWIEKLENTAHQEYNKPHYKNPMTLLTLINQRRDILGRDINYDFEHADSNGDFPILIKERWDYFIKAGYFHINEPQKA